MIYLSEFQCPPSKRRGLDQTGSQTCLICSQQRSFYKFKFLGLTPDHCKQGLCRWWKNRHLSLKSLQLPVKINDIWTLLEGRRTPVPNQLWLARDKGAQRECWGTPKLETPETLFKYPASWVRKTRWQRRKQNQDLSGGGLRNLPLELSRLWGIL